MAFVFLKAIANTLITLLSNCAYYDNKVLTLTINFLNPVDCIIFAVEQLELKRQKKEEERNNIPSLESWLEKYDQMVNKEDGESLQTPWSYPESLTLRQDLPPSMIRFKPEHFSDDNFEEWGK